MTFGRVFCDIYPQSDAIDILAVSHAIFLEETLIIITGLDGKR